MKEINQYLTGKALTGVKLKKVKAVVIHWFADPMAKAANVIKWWQGQANGISAHDVICLNGDLYHAVPYDAMTYQVGCPRGYTKEALKRLSSYPNDCVVGIECAHLDWDGKMTPETYDTLVKHTAKLVKKFGLGLDDIWLHSEIVGKDYKDCHRWFTTTKPSDWIKFKNEVKKLLSGVVKVVSVSKPTTVSKSNKLTFTKTIQLGDKGSDVSSLQSALTKLGYKCVVDGDFGVKTELQLKKFQKIQGLTVDGIAGKITFAKINSLIK